MLISVRAGAVADKAIRRMGYNPASFTMTPELRETIGDALNEAIMKVWSHQRWPQLLRVEKRRFRPGWHEAMIYLARQEVWHAGRYWQAKEDTTGEEPAEGGVWRPMEDGEVVKMIQFEQNWDPLPLDEAGIDLNAFAYEADPRLNPYARAIGGCGFWMDSVVLPVTAPREVWIVFVPRRPRVCFAEWRENTAYNRGEVCFMTVNGECYEALRDGISVSPDTAFEERNAGLWEPVRIPEFISIYLALYALAAWKGEDEGKHQMMAEAEKELERLSETYFDKSGYRAGAKVRVRR